MQIKSLYRFTSLFVLISLVISINPVSYVTALAAPAQTTTNFTFTPVADTYVNSRKSKINYGSSTSLKTDASPVVDSYLRFIVQGLSGQVSQARLMIYANSSSTKGLVAQAVADNSWGETTLNYKNAPALGNTLASSPAVSGGTWVTLDVTSYITGNGTFSFGVTTPGSNAISLESRESGANSPKLIISTSESSIPAATSTSMPVNAATPVVIPPSPTATVTSVVIPPSPTATAMAVNTATPVVILPSPTATVTSVVIPPSPTATPSQTPVAGNVYYVSTTGLDTNPGSLAQPWKTITKVNSTKLSPGDRVLFKRGETWSGITLTVPNSGISGNPILFADYGSGELPSIIGPSGENTIYAYGKSYFTFNNLDVVGNVTGAYGFSISNSHDVTITNCTAHDAASFGIFVNGSGTTTYNITVSNNTVYSNHASGIVLENWPSYSNGPTNITIENNKVYSNGTSIYSDHGIYANVVNGLIRGNITYNNSGAGIKNQSSVNSIFENNISYGTTHSSQTFGFFSGQEASPATNNNNIFRNNVAYNCDIGIYINDGVSGTNWYYHNTVVNDSNTNKTWGFNLSLDAGATNQIIKNNLFFQDSAVVGVTDGTGNYHFDLLGDTANNTYDYNDLYIKNLVGNTNVSINGDDKTFTQWKSLFSTPDAHSFNSDPLFINPAISDFHLQLSSPLCTGGEGGTYIGAYAC